jgi:hypothetical protein
MMNQTHQEATIEHTRKRRLLIMKLSTSDLGASDSLVSAGALVPTASLLLVAALVLDSLVRDSDDPHHEEETPGAHYTIKEAPPIGLHQISGRNGRRGRGGGY